jgi:hypothetical protein
MTRSLGTPDSSVQNFFFARVHFPSLFQAPSSPKLRFFASTRTSQREIAVLVIHLANEKFGVIFTILHKTLILHLVVLSSELLPARA